MKKTIEISIVSLLMTGLAFISTFPLIRNFNGWIPWAAYREDLSWSLLNHPGDNLQVFYFFWLVKENLLGHVPLNSNPYEFNMLGGLTGGNDGFTTAPLAFISFIFSPFGNVAAYNCTVILSYIMAGVFVYLLVRMITNFKIAAFLAAVTFTFIPLRINSLAGGQQFGFVLFLYPFIFYYLEKCIQTQKMRYSFPAALGILALSFNEPHLIYYFFLCMGGYLPIRYLSQIPVNEASGYICPSWSKREIMSYPSWLLILIVFGSGVAVALYAHLVIPPQRSDTFYTTAFWVMVGYYPLILVFFSILCASIYSHLGRNISFQHGLAIEAASMVPLYLFPLLFFIFNKSQMPGTTVTVVCAVSFIAVIKLWFLKSHLYGMLTYLWMQTKMKKKLLVAFSPALFGMAGTVLMTLITKTRALAPSTESGGRTLHDVKLYSAHLQDLFSSTSSVFIGWLPISFGIIFLCYMLFNAGGETKVFKKLGKNRPVYALIAVTLLISQALSMGLALGNRSLYILFFHYIPFFNVPRVSERILSITILLLACIIAGIGQTIFRRWRSRMWMICCSMVFLVLTGMQLKSYMVTAPMAMTDLQPIEDAYQFIKDNIGDNVLLELPLWPGDSHQSSVYEYYTTLDKVKRINGYTPLVSKEYIQTVFNPLHSLDVGELNQDQYELLLRLNVRYITVHEHRDIFTRKVSPHPPATTARRLSNSPYLEYLGPWDIPHKRYNKVHERLHIYRVKDNVKVKEPIVFYTTPAIYRAGRGLYSQTGQVILDETIGRKVYNAVPGRDKAGFLVYGPYHSFFAGKYRCSFSLNYSGNSDGGTGARIEVVRSSKEGQEPLISKDLSGMIRDKEYQDYNLEFEIDKRERLEFRVFYFGTAEISVDKIVVSRKEINQLPDFLEAELMVGEVGSIASVTNASGHKVVEAVPGKDKHGRMVYGPNSTFKKGDYYVIFYIKMSDPVVHQEVHEKVVAVLSVTGHQGNIVFTKKKIMGAGLNDSAFTKIRLDYSLDESEEVGFEVQFTNETAIQLDGIEIVRKKVSGSVDTIRKVHEQGN